MVKLSLNFESKSYRNTLQVNKESETQMSKLKLDKEEENRKMGEKLEQEARSPWERTLGFRKKNTIKQQEEEKGRTWNLEEDTKI